MFEKKGRRHKQSGEKKKKETKRRGSPRDFFSLFCVFQSGVCAWADKGDLGVEVRERRRRALARGREDD